mmetsp:Transcript_31781/g.77216  ORF Transcript_31781/g.77216 Transcript_31781/m.77216 type:complete len:93 (-) Transcript_31781:326-604(-)
MNPHLTTRDLYGPQIVSLFHSSQSTMSEVVLKVTGMSCEGCSGSINNVVGKIDGVTSVNADHDNDKVRSPPSHHSNLMLSSHCCAPSHTGHN